MFYWPNLELTEYERHSVARESGLKKPGTLRRTYDFKFDTGFRYSPGTGYTYDATVRVMEGVYQVSRASRVFALSFGGNVNSWRLRLYKANGEEYFPKFPGGNYPCVSSLSVGSYYHQGANKQPLDVALLDDRGHWEYLTKAPMVIDPNWELNPNESVMIESQCMLDGLLTPIAGRTSIQQLSLAFHVWEFPDLVRGAVSK